MAGATSNDVVNQALQLMGGNQPTVNGYAPTFDSSTAGRAAAALYYPTVATVTRQKAWGFTRKEAALQVSGNGPPSGWQFEYLYPADAVQVWQLTSPAADPNDPRPVNYEEAVTVANNQTVKVLRTNLVNAYAIYGSTPPESTWDSLFREAVVSLLASNFAMAIAGKPDAMAALQERGAAFEQIGEGRDD